MSEGIIGIFGTLIGVLLGFVLSWLKEYLEERKEIFIEVEKMNIDILQPADIEYTAQATLWLSVHSRSTIRKPFWGISIEWELDPTMVHPCRETYEKDYLLYANPKSSELLEYSWNVPLPVAKSIREYKEAKMYLKYKVFKKEITIEIPFTITETNSEYLIFQ
jgi:hypothetical protein